MPCTALPFLESVQLLNLLLEVLTMLVVLTALLVGIRVADWLKL